jgi:hypothetical protein
VVDLAFRLLSFLFGGGLIVLTLRSAIHTFVLPRGVPDRLPRLLFRGMRLLFDVRTRRAATYEQRDRVMAMYAPLSLVLLPGVYLTLTMLGYAGVFWALGAETWRIAFTLSGSSILTLGFATVEDLPKTLVMFSEGGIGLTLVALVISYLPTMYAAFSRRENLVTMLEVRAGSPPSAIELIKRYDRLARWDKLNDLWVQWESWFADVEETHTSFGALTFFRSPQPDHSWVTAAGAVLDAASLVVAAVDIPPDPQANLCLRAGYICFRRICDFQMIPYDLAPQPTDPISIARAEFDAAYDELRAAGVPMKADRAQAWRDFSGWRVNYDRTLLALAALTMAPFALWSSDRSSRPGASLSGDPVRSNGIS